jgi:alpha-1,2-rhamnosyltransferase
MNLYLDYTDLLDIDSHTGIQRTQTNLISNILLLSSSLGINCHAVANIKKNHFIKLDTSFNHTCVSLKYPFSVYLGLHQPWRFLRLVKIIFPNKTFLRVIEPLWQRGYGTFLFIPLSFIMLPSIFASTLFCTSESSFNRITPSRNDIFFIGGTSLWDTTFISSLQYIKSCGAHIVCLIHDIIPIDYPSYCSLIHVHKFQHNLPHILTLSDIILTNSSYTKECLERHLTASGASTRAEIIPIRFGVNLDKATSSTNIRASLVNSFGHNSSVYLTVGTIEPRKNHDFLLKAFHEIWNTNPDTRLCIVGRYGWNMDKFRQALIAHPKYGTRLFWFHDLNDAELEFCYRNAKALVFPSMVEGFGLPLVEALHYGCPVLASDIPVFREIGGNSCSYFSLESPGHLIAMIRRIETGPHDAILKRVDNFRWITWEKSAADILDLIRSKLGGPEDGQGRREAPPSEQHRTRSSE